MDMPKESLPPPGWGLEGSVPGSVAASLLEAFPRGQLSEIVGPRSAGGSSLVTSLLAHATAAGELVAFVDGADAFDPAAAAAAGAALRSLFWVRTGRRLDHACRAAELLARSGGFAWVVLDLAADPTAPANRPVPSLSAATWIRLQRAVRDSPTRLVLHASRHLAGSAAVLVLAVERGPARWIGAPRPMRLAGIGSRVEVVRSRMSSPPPSPRPSSSQGGRGSTWELTWRL
jgi:recA bacterial DNA recombination protein